MYTVEHNFFFTASWQNLVFVLHGGYMVDTVPLTHSDYSCNLKMLSISQR